MKKPEEVQKAKDLLTKRRLPRFLVELLDDVTDNYDVSFQEAQHCLEAVSTRRANYRYGKGRDPRICIRKRLQRK